VVAAWANGAGVGPAVLDCLARAVRRGRFQPPVGSGDAIFEARLEFTPSETTDKGTARLLRAEPSTSAHPQAEVAVLPHSNAATEEACAQLLELWDEANLARSEVALREYATEQAEAGQTACYIEAGTQVARAQGLQGNLDAAHRTLDELIPLLEQDWAGAAHKARAQLRVQLERARLHSASPELSQAGPLLVKVWERARLAKEDALAVDAACSLAVVHAGEPALAAEWSGKAMALAQSSPSSAARRWVPSLLTSQGWLHAKNGRNDAALSWFRQALQEREKQLELATEGASRAAQRGVWDARYALAKTLRLLGQISEAYALHLKTRAEPGAQIEAPGLFYEEFAECQLALGLSGHVEGFRVAYEKLSKDPSFALANRERLERIRGLAKLETPEASGGAPSAPQP
jgi:tetratricopeptide (TPR) repeat protein